MRKNFVNEADDEEEDDMCAALERVCNDKNAFREAFNDYKTGLRDLLPEVMIEYGDDLGWYIKDTDWSLEKVLPMILKSLKEDGKHNKPLQNGNINCYFLFDNDDYDATFETYDTEKDWIEAIREMCLDKEIWTYEDEVYHNINELPL